MALSRSQARLYAELVERHGRLIADAFFKAMADLRALADVQRVTAALEAGNIDAAVDALSLDPAVYNDVLEKVRAAHMEGGNTAAAAMPKRGLDGVALAIRFDGRNLGAERILAEQSAKLITRMVAGDREVARRALTEGMVRGDNPKRVALDVVGRVSRVTGKREGGVLGLSAPQERAVAAARRELASSNPKLLRNYLRRPRRDKRFDRSVEKAILEGGALPKDKVGRMITAYSNSLLKRRGDVVGMHETFSAIESAKAEAYRQAVESGKVPAAAVTKTWRHFDSKNPRHQHVEIDGQTVALNDPFVMPDGTVMQHPHDPNAPVGHTAGCLCQADYRIDFLAGLR